MATHEVLNQTPPLAGYNPFAADPTLVAAVRRERGGWAEPELREFGDRAGSPEVIEWGFLANEYPPVLRTHDPVGNRIDAVVFHPAWHSLMELSVFHGLHSLPWEADAGNVVRAAFFYVISQIEAGHGCPISMTCSVVPSLRLQSDVAAEWEPRITRAYDPTFRPPGEKRGVLFGMALTEKQGGSDVRANASRATPVGAGGPGGEYLLTGHKWFCSAPQQDAFLVTANAPGGLSCFLLPRWRPDNTPNPFHIQRLKDKMGNRSNASSEIEFDGAHARMVGEEGRGIRTIVEMINHTRLDCVIGSAALSRQAVSQAVHHAQHRSAFGKLLTEQPLMRNVLADLTVESEGMTVLMMRLAGAYDGVTDEDAAFRRLATPLAKYWTCKRAPHLVAEALECLGGNGVVEESVMPRLYREAPVNSVWEGSGNVIALDMIRAMHKDPDSVEAVLAEIDAGRGHDDGFDRIAASVRDRIPVAAEYGARALAEDLSLALQGSLLIRHGHDAVAAAFLASRFSVGWGRTFGTLPAGQDLDAIIERADPRAD
jgi:putative acyl-CoA dehydrogenase